ncbi:mannose-6-phosphate isomerase-like protein (cupin superfamily) [Aequitasia blattaphilus]|uniref:Cupin domain-containing protein n=1 Tax=Aequitasia blattaphilus TaxID=2949332 RepID=A0ABT1E6P6_9FIRM|nr:cupin domain-containing protein [Aequitasia blattaphilus]MCP1101489.1 cupin domain-containing protein [Aequitasia blattaphilus]MCR8614129.1 cupin domain-containing protein [Aequitasia blattaphilus]
MRTSTVIKQNLHGGEGQVSVKNILTENEMKDKCGLFGEIVIEPGASLGFHMHEGESETYYILSGEGIYDDNGTTYPVGPGEVTFTPSGSGHGMVNSGSEDLVFMALIIKD